MCVCIWISHLRAKVEEGTSFHWRELVWFTTYPTRTNAIVYVYIYIDRYITYTFNIYIYVHVYMIQVEFNR